MWRVADSATLRLPFLYLSWRKQHPCQFSVPAFTCENRIQVLKAGTRPLVEHPSQADKVYDNRFHSLSGRA